MTFKFGPIKYAVALLAITALFVFGIFSRVYAQDDAINSKLSETKDDITKLLNIKDDLTLNPAQKENLEIELKRKIISNVLEISLDQVETAKSQLDKISMPETDEWNSVRDYLSNLLNKDSQYYQDTQNIFNDSPGLNLNELSSFVKKLEEKKSTDIDLDLQKVNVIMAELSMSDILSVTDDRLAKVSSDINKIYSKKLTQNQTLKKMFNQASEAVKKAHDLDDQARSMIINVYTNDTGTSTRDFVSALKEKILKSKEGAFAASSTSTADNKIKLTVTSQDLDNYLADLATQAYNSIKNAYDIFVKMSINVKTYLK